jgi:nucleoside 2-deoxyribosyltransferase
LALVAKADALIICGKKITDGMQEEIQYAMSRGIPCKTILQIKGKAMRARAKHAVNQNESAG